MKIAEIITSMRMHYGISQHQLARETGLVQGTISAIELGRGEPNLKTLVLIAQAFGTTVSKLTEGL